MDLQELEAFYQVSREKNFGRAAGNLHLSQPAVSTRIANLEEELETELFARKGKTIEVTADGQLLLDYAERVFSLIEEVKGTLRQSRSTMKKSLRIGTTSRIGTYILPALLETFQADYPEVAVSLRTGQSENMVQMLADNLLDCAFVSRVPPLKGYAKMKIDEDDVVVVCSPGHSLMEEADKAGGISSLPIGALNGCTLIHLYEETQYNSFLRKHHAVPGHFLSVDNLETVKRMVERKLGVAFLPRAVVQQELKRKTLAEIGLEGMQPQRKISYFIYPKKRFPNPALTAFAGQIENRAKNGKK